MTQFPEKADDFNFEKSLDELTKLVEQMEQGNLSVDKSLESFEKGINLIRQCQNALEQAEQKVKILMRLSAECYPVRTINDF